MVATDEPAAKPFVGLETRIVSEDYYEEFGGDAWDLANGFSVLKDGAGGFIEPILPDGHRAGDFTNVQDLLDSLTREHA
jgi:hypothetical protein